MDEAHNALGWVKYLAQWDWIGAEQEFQRAIQLNQNNSQAHINYAAVLSAQGKHEQALQEGRVALRLDPSSGDVYYNHILHLFHARRFDEALSMSKKGMQVDPDHPRWMTLIPRIYLAHALDWLEIAYQERDTIMTHLKVDPLFDSLQSQARFQELLRRMHLIRL